MITPFQFDSTSIRAITDDQGNPWFVASDISAALEYSEASAMTRALDEDEKGLRTVQPLDGLKYGKNLTSPRNQRETQPHWYVEKFAELIEFATK